MRAIRHSRGFTLVELIAVMALLAAIFGIVAPALSPFFSGRRLHDEARRFLGLTRYAREQAISLGETMVIWIDLRERTYGLKAQNGYTVLKGKVVEFEFAKSVEIEFEGFEIEDLEIEDLDSKGGSVIRFVFRPDGGLEGKEFILHDDRKSALAILPSETGLGFVIEAREWDA